MHPQHHPYLKELLAPLLSSTRRLSSAAFSPGPRGAAKAVLPVLSKPVAAPAGPVGLKKPMIGNVLPEWMGGLWLRCCQLGPSSLSHTKHLRQHTDVHIGKNGYVRVLRRSFMVLYGVFESHKKAMMGLPTIANLQYASP